MVKRWFKLIQVDTPRIDLIEVSGLNTSSEVTRRQFAPLYSQSAYKAMLDQDTELGDYVTEKN